MPKPEIAPQENPPPARYETRPLAQRRIARPVRVGSVVVGGDAPIAVQSMTDTDTRDHEATLAQVRALAHAGADIVRVSCPDRDATDALKKIAAASPVPVVADIHFHYKRAIEAAQAGAACLRFNPGNIGNKQRVAQVVAAARDHQCAIRIGVNAGSLERDLLETYRAPTPEALVASALRHAELLEELDFQQYKISAKASDVPLAVRAYRLLARQTRAPLHIGITEAGPPRSGSVRSAVGLGVLLAEGIGDTLRVSLAGDPVEEVHAAFVILKALGLRARGLSVIACPGCARQQFDVATVAAALERRFAHLKTPLKVSVMGCVVNGPGEARSSAVGLTGGGRGTHQLYLNGKQSARFSTDGAQGPEASAALIARLEELIARALEDQDSAREPGR